MSAFFQDPSVDTNSGNHGTAPYSPSQNRTLHVYYKGWRYRTVQVMDEDKVALLYEIEIRSHRPNMTFRRPALNNSIIGTVRFHPLTRAIEAEVNNHSFKLKGKNWTSCNLQWNSPAFGGRVLTWKRQTLWVVLETILMDENKMPLARFSPSSWSMKKAGTIDLVDGGIGQEAIDEIVITGLAVLKDAIDNTAGAS